MKTKQTTRLAALLLVLCVLLAGCANPLDLMQARGFVKSPAYSYGGGSGGSGSGGDSYYSGDGSQRYSSRDYRYTIPYGEMEYLRPDIEAMKETLADLTEKIEAARSFDQLLEYDYESGVLWMEFNSMYVLAMLGTYQDYDSPFWAEEYSLLVDAAVELENLNNELNNAILSGRFADAYQEYVGEFLFNSLETSTLLNSPEVEAYKQERGQLGVQYNNDLMNATVEWDGESLSMEEIFELDSYPAMLGAYTEYYRSNAEHFADLYIRMIELDKLTAEELGFASAADMYYLYYNRDYTPADAEGYIAASKQAFTGLAGDVLATGGLYAELDMEDVLEAMPYLLSLIDGELVEAWQHMQDNDLYDIEARSSKQSGIAFEVNISMYDAPFLYSYWEGTFSSANTIIHEFGHYFDDWLHYDVSTVFNLDIAESYSQGMEVLAQPYYGLLLQDTEAAVRQNLYSFYQSITYQLLLEELQLRVYEIEDLSAARISQLYTDLLYEYGYGELVWSGDDDLDHSWFEVTHLFDSPFYTISYATSATVALQIWAESQQDWERAVDIYMDMIHADQNQPFVQLVESVGLANPLSAETLEDIAGLFAGVFGS